MTPEEVRQIVFMAVEEGSPYAKTDEIRQSIDMVLEEHKKSLKGSDFRVDSWNRGYHDGLMEARKIAWRRT
ncbi:hypothetical protein LCGC14_1119540 [marine sediment metagenome]|uniref:Uncharacterized protein n=1 Tax=marine sediment metagenome TaxID=412755 RepID=A0A0F9M980_9ZZZZ